MPCHRPNDYSRGGVLLGWDCGTLVAGDTGGVPFSTGAAGCDWPVAGGFTGTCPEDCGATFGLEDSGAGLDIAAPVLPLLRVGSPAELLPGSCGELWPALP